jgi:hypothetical protein
MNPSNDKIMILIVFVFFYFQKKNKGTLCEFYETMVNGYIQYRSVVDETKYIGFTKNGRPIKLIQNPKKFDENCFNFFKWNLTIHSSKTIELANNNITFKNVQNTRNINNNNNSSNNNNNNTNKKFNNTKNNNNNNNKKKKSSTNCNCNAALKKNCCLENKLLPSRRRNRKFPLEMNIFKPNLQPDMIENIPYNINNNKKKNNNSSYNDDFQFESDDYLLQQHSNISTNNILPKSKIKKDGSLKKSRIPEDLIKLRHSYGIINHRKRSTTLDSF